MPPWLGMRLYMITLFYPIKLSQQRFETAIAFNTALYEYLGHHR